MKFSDFASFGPYGTYLDVVYRRGGGTYLDTLEGLSCVSPVC